MSCRRQGFLLAALVALQASLAQATEAGTKRPPYQQVVAGLSELVQRNPGWAAQIDYGVTPEGRVLRALRLGLAKGPGQGPRPAVLITGSTHGDEYLHIEDQLPGWFLSHRAGPGGVAQFFAAGGVMLIVPVVNPDGYSAGSRHNSHDIDLNRDFAPSAQKAAFDEVETRLISQWLAAEVQNQDLELKLTVDYHCCSGALLFPRAYQEGELKAKEARLLRTIGRLAVQDIDRHLRYGASDRVLGYDPVGTSKDYYFTTYRALAMTFEGRYGGEAQALPAHTRWWGHVLAQLLD